MSKPSSGIKRKGGGGPGGGGGAGSGGVRDKKKELVASTIQKVEKILEMLDHEEAVFFDKNGRFVATVRGTRTQVVIPDELYGVDGLTVTHNHPKEARNFGTSLSIGDFRAMMNSNWHQLRAISGGQGAGLYILQRGANARPKAFDRYLRLVGDRIRTKADDMFFKLRDEEFMKDGNLLRAEHIAAQKAYGLTHAKMKKIASHFGFDYVRRKNPHRWAK